MSVELAETEEKANRALETRRAAATAREMPEHWLLDRPGLAPQLALAGRFAEVATMPVLIQGERGSGTQELARFIHDHDPDAKAGRFRVVRAQLVGPMEMRGWSLFGTLFVEDVEDLRAVGQDWIANILANRTSDNPSFRIIGSSRFGVTELLGRRHLDQELIHSLDVSRLVIPPLRERPAEILLLARRFLAHYGGPSGRRGLRLSLGAEQRLLDYSYPSNVRELRNAIERAVAIGRPGEDEVPAESIVFYDVQTPRATGGVSHEADCDAPLARIGRLPTLAEMERSYLVMLIRELKGRRTDISRAMGVSYPTVLKKIAHYGLDVRSIVASAKGAQVTT